MALIGSGQDAHTEVGLAKVAAARMLQRVVDSAVQVHGAAGLGPDTPLPALLRTGRAARILDGPDELHITSVARRVLRGYEGPGSRRVRAYTRVMSTDPSSAASPSARKKSPHTSSCRTASPFPAS